MTKLTVPTLEAFFSFSPFIVVITILIPMIGLCYFLFGSLQLNSWGLRFTKTLQVLLVNCLIIAITFLYVFNVEVYGYNVDVHIMFTNFHFSFFDITGFDIFVSNETKKTLNDFYNLYIELRVNGFFSLYSDFFIKNTRVFTEHIKIFFVIVFYLISWFIHTVLIHSMNDVNSVRLVTLLFTIFFLSIHLVL